MSRHRADIPELLFHLVIHLETWIVFFSLWAEGGICWPRNRHFSLSVDCLSVEWKLIWRVETYIGSLFTIPGFLWYWVIIHYSASLRSHGPVLSPQSPWGVPLSFWGPWWTEDWPGLKCLSPSPCEWVGGTVGVVGGPLFTGMMNQAELGGFELLCVPSWLVFVSFPCVFICLFSNYLH